MKNLVVYTAIFGDYDSLNEIECPNSDFDYVCFTDNKELTSSTWEIRTTSLFNIDSCRQARQLKIYPHKYLREYEYSMWIDGNMQLCVTPSILLLLDETSLALCKHPTRDCIYEEGIACKDLHKDSPNIINEQLSYYKEALKFPTHAGLWQTGILLRKHNDESLNKLSDLWWEQILKHSKRDQLSFPIIFQGYNFVSLPWNLMYQMITLRQHG